MKTYSYSGRNALILITCLLFLITYPVSQAMSSDAQSRRAGVAGSAVAQPVEGAARLIVRRLPGLGWPSPLGMILDVRSGQTYSFTAMGDSGHLILEAPGGLERPRGR